MGVASIRPYSESESEARILSEIGDSITEETIPASNIRRDLTSSITELVRNRDFDGMSLLLDFIIQQIQRYSRIADTRDWIEALTDPLPPPEGIPRSLYNFLTPPARLADFPANMSQRRRSLRRFGHYRRLSQALIEDRTP